MAEHQSWIFNKSSLEELVRAHNVGDLAKERENRFKTVWFLTDLSAALRPHIRKDDGTLDLDVEIRNLKVLWTACVFFHRFFVFHSFEVHHRFTVAVACLFLAAKVEEKPLRLKDHVGMYFRVRKNMIPPEPERKKMERKVLLAERILLQTLNFDLNVIHPHFYFRNIIVRELKNYFTDPDDGKQVMRLATTLVTDSMRTTLCLEYQPSQLAFGLVFVAITILSLRPSTSVTVYGVGSGKRLIGGGDDGHSDDWLAVFEKDIDELVLKEICFRILDTYKVFPFDPQAIPFTQLEANNARSHIADMMDEANVKNSRHNTKTDHSEIERTPYSEDIVAAANNCISSSSEEHKDERPPYTRIKHSEVLGKSSTLCVKRKNSDTISTMPPPPVDILPPTLLSSRPNEVFTTETSHSSHESECTVLLQQPPGNEPHSSMDGALRQHHTEGTINAQPYSVTSGTGDYRDCSVVRSCDVTARSTPVSFSLPPPPPPDTPGSMASTPNFSGLAHPVGHSSEAIALLGVNSNETIPKRTRAEY